MKTMKEKHPHGNHLFPFEVFNQSAIKDQLVCYLHWHEEVEWVYVYKGSVRLFLDGIEYTLTTGQMMVIEPKFIHYMTAKEDCQYYTCVFDKQLLQFTLEDYTSFQYINPYIKGTLVMKSPIEIKNTLIEECFFNIVYLNNLSSSSSQLKIKLSLLEIFSYFIDHHYLMKNTQTKHNLDVIEKLLLYIEENYQHKLTSQELAKLVNYNYQYFSRFFKENTGYSPIEYINHYRIEKACKQLVNLDHSILEISMNCGFDSCSYFIKKFKEYKKISPSQYRKTITHSYNDEKTY